MDLKTLDFTSQLLSEQFTLSNSKKIKNVKSISDLQTLSKEFRAFISKFETAKEIKEISDSQISDSQFSDETDNEKRYKALKNQRNQNVERFTLWAQFRYLISLELSKQNFVSAEQLEINHDYKAIYQKYGNLPFDFETFVTMTNDTEKSNSFILALLPKEKDEKSKGKSEKELINEKFRTLDGTFPNFALTLLDENTKSGGTKAKSYTFTYQWSINFHDSFIESQKAFETVYLTPEQSTPEQTENK